MFEFYFILSNYFSVFNFVPINLKTYLFFVAQRFFFFSGSLFVDSRYF